MRYPYSKFRYNARRMPTQDPRKLLLAPGLEDVAVAAILQPYGFEDYRRADANLQSLADEPWARQHLADLIETLLESLAESANPDQALGYLESFAKAGAMKLALFSYLKTSPAALHLLTTVFGASPSLSQILIRNPEYLHWVTRPEVLNRMRPERKLKQDLQTSLSSIRSKEHRLDALRRFKRRELLAIGVRDLLGNTTVEETTRSLSMLADLLIQEAYGVCRQALTEQYGRPRSGFTVLAMGKLGGGELNFSSDVDLIYLCGSDTGTTYFRRLAQDLTHALSDITKEGYLFRVDLRLRPEGRVGEIVGSFDQFRRYYRGSRGQAWEKLAHIKARPIAGDTTLGKRFLSMMRPFVYQSWHTASPHILLSEVRRIKRLIDDKMTKHGESQRNVKLGIGGIREIELTVQTLQTLFGRVRPAIQERNTVKALTKLMRARLISLEEHQFLVEAYWFLRNVEHKLQMVEEQQTHTLSADPLELRRCALRLGYRDSEEGKSTERFSRDHARYTERVHEIFTSVMAGERLAKSARRAG